MLVDTKYLQTLIFTSWLLLTSKIFSIFVKLDTLLDFIVNSKNKNFWNKASIWFAIASLLVINKMRVSRYIDVEIHISFM